MVTITGYEKKEGEKGTFFLLQLQGEIEFAYSKNTGMPYATVRKCTIPSSLDEKTCKQSIGQKLRGSIVKVTSEPYEYTQPETGEKVSIDYRYSYSPHEESSMEEAVFQIPKTLEEPPLM